MILTVCIFDQTILLRHFKIKLGIPSWIAKHGKTELVHFLNCRNESVKMANTTTSPNKSVKYLVVLLDKKLKNLTFEAHVQSVLGKMAKHVSVVMRLRHFCESSIVVRHYNIHLKPIRSLSLRLHEEK